MTKNIVLLGASLESDNRGVNALGIGAITLLKSNYGNIVPNIITLGPEEKVVEKEIWLEDENLKVKIHYFNSKTMYLASFTPIRNVSTKKLINIISQGDLFYDINEGDSFSDIYGFKRILRHYVDSNLVLKENKDLIFLPQTIGPFKSKLGRVLSKYILKKLHAVYVRDDKFVADLDKMGIKYTQTIDMAVYMAPKEVDFDVPDNTVGLNINGLMYFNSYKSMQGKYLNYKRFVTELINSFLDKGFKVLLLPHTYNHNRPNREDDLLAIKDLKTCLYSQNSNVLFSNEDYDAQEMKYIISKTIFFMGSRMHSCIAALSRSVPTVGLAYSYKFSGTFKMFGCEEHVVNLVEINEDHILELVKTIHCFFDKRLDTQEDLLKTNKRELLKL